MTRRLFYGVALAIITLLLVAVWVTPANGTADYITVDGQQYAATQYSGPVIHFETPDSDPQSAFTDRNVWTGNGSDNLPCEGGIHWIDNKNLLTVSHCLPPTTTTTSTSTTTTTTQPPTTTTTSPTTTTTTTSTTTTTTTVPTTTTTTEATTTTTEPSSTTTTDPVITTTSVVVTTTIPEVVTDLPNTGFNLSVAAALAFGLLLLGTAALVGRRSN